MQPSKEIEQLNDVLRPRWLSGLWNVDHAERPSDPKTRVKPHLWKWHDIYDSLIQAKEKISVASGSVERRVIRLVNPGMADSEMTSHTILLSFQLIQPGEVAPAHRHTMAAFRFILQGRGAYTNVDGQKMVMEDGDLILTPHGCWHEHAHEGDENMVWIDGLDVPFIQALHQISFDPYESGRLPVRETIDPAVFYGMTRPIDGATPEAPPLLHYHWRDTYAALQRLARTSGNAFDGAALEFKLRRVRWNPLVQTLEQQVAQAAEAAQGGCHDVADQRTVALVQRKETGMRHLAGQLLVQRLPVAKHDFQDVGGDLAGRGVHRTGLSG